MYIERTDSTNTLFKKMLAEGNFPSGGFIRTNYQTAGRGQSGNGWESEKGKNLLCSLGIGCNHLTVTEQFELNILVSIAVYRSLRDILFLAAREKRHITPLSIKWPNDIYWKDKKIAGILIETVWEGNYVKYAIAGIGINFNQTEFLSDAPNPISYKLITGKDFFVNDAMGFLLGEIERLSSWKKEDLWAFYKAHLYRKDGFWPFVEREVSIAPTMNYSPSLEDRHGERLERPIFLAKIEDVRTDGELELRDKDGNLRTYHFKEVRYVL